MLGRVVGRFRIVEKIGEGGMGTVWKAEDVSTGEVVALKFLNLSAATSIRHRRRFLREARAVSSLQHPGVPAVLEAAELDGELYIAGEFVDGKTVADLIASGPLPLIEAVRIASEAARVIEHAHVKGVVHRDITSSNIMYARDGTVKVIDFGLALLRNASALTSSATTLGTIGYISPEMLSGKAAGRHADVYGLGVVLFEMTTGRLPFLGEQIAAQVNAILNSRPPRPSDIRPEIGPKLERAIMKAMAREPKRRHPSAAELADALQAIPLPETRRAPASRGAGRATRKVDFPEDKILAVLPFEERVVTRIVSRVE